MKELILAFLYMIRQSAQFIDLTKSVTLGGNIDPLFLVALFYFYELSKHKMISKKVTLIILSLIAYSIFQLLFLPDINFFRVFINITKIILCLLILFYTIKHYDVIDIPKFMVSVSGLYFIVTIFALTFIRNASMWTIFDTVNKSVYARLKLFYLEPSELGFHVMIIMIFLTGYFLSSKNRKTKTILLISLLMNIFVLYYTLSFGAIIIGIVSIVIMLAIDWYRHRTKEKNEFYFGLILAGLIVLVTMFLIKAPILQRLIDTVQGKDESNWYRVDVALKVAKQAFTDFKGIGIGFGNMNSVGFIERYAKFGFIQVMVNSFPYFIVEGGVYAIVFLAVLIGKLVKAILSSRSIIKIGLFAFLMVYQLVGSHFTNALIWMLYGIILSTFDEHTQSKYVFESWRNWLVESPEEL